MVRFTDYCVNRNLPVIDTIEPLRMKEIRGIKGRSKKELFEFEGEGNWIEDVKWEKRVEAVIANAESRMEIADNLFTVPLATKSKLRQSNGLKQAHVNLFGEKIHMFDEQIN